MPKISICTPVYQIPKRGEFMSRLIKSLEQQTFTDFEFVVTEEGKMAENTNAAIRQAQGKIIKILYMDDFLAHKNALKNIVDNFKGGWLVTGCTHTDGLRRFNEHMPEYTDDIHTGNNKIGSPSVLTFENKEPLYFDETMTWLLDCDYYKRLHERYGAPTILNDINVVIGVGEHQATHSMPEETMIREHNYLIKKYGN